MPTSFKFCLGRVVQWWHSWHGRPGIFNGYVCLTSAESFCVGHLYAYIIVTSNRWVPIDLHHYNVSAHFFLHFITRGITRHSRQQQNQRHQHKSVYPCPSSCTSFAFFSHVISS